jgi:hypothetical protein
MQANSNEWISVVPVGGRHLLVGRKQPWSSSMEDREAMAL